MAASAPGISLEDRYRLEEGLVYLSGIQALVRLPIDQSRRDRRAGLRIGTFISGYPGSPLGGYDLALRQAGRIIAEHGIVHQPGQNEELAATAISGTQMLDHYPHSRYDGVVGIWYGKGPGVDRSGDALKHGNFAGTSKHGAVIVLSGDDHEAKSSTMPYQDDYAFVAHGMPIVYPSSVAEFLELGLHAIAMSRFSGCWVAMKLVGQLADGGQTVAVHPDVPAIAIPEVKIDGKPFSKRTDFRFFPGLNVETERQLYYERHLAARAYARANRLDRLEVGSSRDRLAIVTAGKSYADVRQALVDFGIDDAEMGRLGIRLVKIGLLYPLDQQFLREALHGVDEAVVVEEKRGFLEAQVKEALHGSNRPPRVVGKFDERGQPLFPIQGGLDSDLVAERLGPRLLESAGAHAGILARLAQLRAARSRPYEILPTRTPNYCSGCPHNTSTRLLDGQVAWGSPGCHSFASIIEQPERQIVSMTQLGGEGLPWIGLAPFTDLPHLVQNVGDGSLFHSSYLNIRFCVAAGVSITFKILYNGSIANTGAQDSVGSKTVPELARLLSIEGVRRVAVISREPARYRGVDLGPATTVHPAEDSERVLAELAATPGVTVYLYDGMCANERRRKQKRGILPAANRFVVINPDVCENCGHCGSLTNCMSLHKVETELGEKTQIHYSSCNLDLSCLAGDCPSFLTVETRPGTGLRKRRPPALDADDLPEPAERAGLERPYHVYMPGVGGTGVITTNAILAWAALLDGKHVLSYDQTGAAQKWGTVLSSLVIGDAGQRLAANKVGVGRADLYLALDPMAAAAKANLERCDPGRTRAVVNTTMLPSGEMIRNVGFKPPLEIMETAIARHTDRERMLRVPARHLAERLFGDYMATNLVALGAAYQAGLLPLSAASIERAIALNGVQVDQNLQAFRYGRLFVADAERVRTVTDGNAPSWPVAPRRAPEDSLSGRDRQAFERLLARCQGLDDESRRLLAYRIADLIAYQEPSYAARYVVQVLRVGEREQAATPGRREITHQVIRNLYKLMAYKDEYEVARLHLKAENRLAARALFDEPRRVTYHLHPPILRALGLQRKLRLGTWFDPALASLKRLKRLRGTVFDPFGYAAVRREERRLIGWYLDLLEAALARLRPETHALAVEIASLPDEIRGYEEIKLRNAARARARAEDLLERLEHASVAEAARA